MTDIFKLIAEHQFGEIYFKNCQKTGMQAIIAIHNTKLGPALGGLRFVHYDNSEQAILDAIRLAQGMSYKAAMANLPLGGGKAVILKPTQPFSREDYMLSFGSFVNTLNGRYITALDSGTELSDMDIIATRTQYLASRSDYYGDPSPSTVYGVMEGIKAACKVKFNQDHLSGLTMAIQGLGHVGESLAKILTDAGVKLYIADINEQKTQGLAQTLQQTAVAPEKIHTLECDVFIPCALGSIINAQSINELRCKVVAGAANNQLIDISMAYALHDRNILYVPDYIINAGGLIYAAGRYLQTTDSDIEKQIHDIYSRVIDISLRSIKENIPPSVIVDQIAKEKIMAPFQSQSAIVDIN